MKYKKLKNILLNIMISLCLHKNIASENNPTNSTRTISVKPSQKKHQNSSPPSLKKLIRAIAKHIGVETMYDEYINYLSQNYTASKITRSLAHKIGVGNFYDTSISPFAEEYAQYIKEWAQKLKKPVLYGIPTLYILYKLYRWARPAPLAHEQLFEDFKKWSETYKADFQNNMNNMLNTYSNFLKNAFNYKMDEAIHAFGYSHELKQGFFQDMDLLRRNLTLGSFITPSFLHQPLPNPSNIPTFSDYMNEFNKEKKELKNALTSAAQHEEYVKNQK